MFRYYTKWKANGAKRSAASPKSTRTNTILWGKFWNEINPWIERKNESMRQKNLSDPLVHGGLWFFWRKYSEFSIPLKLQLIENENVTKTKHGAACFPLALPFRPRQRTKNQGSIFWFFNRISFALPSRNFEVQPYFSIKERATKKAARTRI